MNYLTSVGSIDGCQWACVTLTDRGDSKGGRKNRRKIKNEDEKREKVQKAREKRNGIGMQIKREGKSYQEVEYMAYHQ